MNLSRRVFITSAALAPVACGVPLGYERGTPVAQPRPLPAIRPPQIGQEWTYIKRDVFDGKNLGLVTERVSSIGSTIVIERSDESGGRLANEVQGPWGMVLTDPQWPKVVSFSPAIPLWPQELSATWNKQFITKYKLAGYPDSAYNWQQYMSAHGWEQITVPAGTFLTLHFRYHLDHYGWAPEEGWVMPGSYQLVKIYWDVLKTSYVLAELNGDPR